MIICISIYICVCLSAFLSSCTFLCLSPTFLCLSVHFSVCLNFSCLHVCLSVHISIILYIMPPIGLLSVCLYALSVGRLLRLLDFSLCVSLSECMSVCQTVLLSIYVYVSQSTCTFLCLPAQILSICTSISVCKPLAMFVCFSVYLNSSLSTYLYNNRSDNELTGFKFYGYIR